jgi:hypothetical protein
VPSPVKECFLQFISRDCAGRLLEIQSSGFLTNESSALLLGRKRPTLCFCSSNELKQAGA